MHTAFIKQGEKSQTRQTFDTKWMVHVAILFCFKFSDGLPNITKPWENVHSNYVWSTLYIKQLDIRAQNYNILVRYSLQITTTVR